MRPFAARKRTWMADIKKVYATLERMILVRFPDADVRLDLDGIVKGGYVRLRNYGLLDASFDYDVEEDKLSVRFYDDIHENDVKFNTDIGMVRYSANYWLVDYLYGMLVDEEDK